MKADLVTDGEFKGWLTWASEAFEHDTAGPFFFEMMTKVRSQLFAQGLSI